MNILAVNIGNVYNQSIHMYNFSDRGRSISGWGQCFYMYVFIDLKKIITQNTNIWLAPHLWIFRGPWILACDTGKVYNMLPLHLISIYSITCIINKECYYCFHFTTKTNKKILFFSSYIKENRNWWRFDALGALYMELNNAHFKLQDN